MLNNPYIKTALIILVIFITIVLIQKTFTFIISKSKERVYIIKGVQDAKISNNVSRKVLLDSRIGNEFTYSFWIKVDDWGYNFSKPKHVFHVGDSKGKSVCPGVWLYPKNNNLMVRVDTFDRYNNIDTTISGKKCQNWASKYPHDHKFNPSEYIDSGLGDHNYCRNPNNDKNVGSWCYTTDPNVETESCSNKKYTEPSSMNPLNNPSQIKEPKQCDIVNIPIQRWVHAVIILSNRTLDVYLNGKLSRSCTLKNVPITNKGDIYINQDGGFNGYISDLLYINSAINASEVSDLFNSGNDKISLSNMLNKIKLSQCTTSDTTTEKCTSED